MQRMSATLVVMAGVALSGCDTPSQPVTAAEPATAASVATTRDFTGVWIAIGTFEDPAGPPPWSNTLWPSNPPFTEWGAAESRRISEPEGFTPCTPTGPVFAMWELGLFPIQILESPGQLVIIRETGGMPRRIYTDGREHPPADELEPTWMGHSIGRWEGDVFVVDTIGTNGRARAMNGVGSNAKVSVDDAKPRLPTSDAAASRRAVAAGRRRPAPRGRAHDQRSENLHGADRRQALFPAAPGHRHAGVLVHGQRAHSRRDDRPVSTIDEVTR